MPQEMGEFDWDGTKELETKKKIRRTEIAGIVIFVLLISAGIAAFIPFGDLIVTDEELAEQYATTIEWINRCDEDCRQNVNIKFIDSQTDCKGLQKQYEMERNNYLLDWRIAIDDKAASIGCSGYPKEMKAIRADTNATILAMQQREQVARIEKEEEEQKRAEQQWPLYRQSLRNGGIQQYVVKFQQDDMDQSIMVIVVSNLFLMQEEYLRKQIAEVLWQKWVNIRDQLTPSNVRIRLLHPKGGVIGGSPAGGATPIWVKTDEQMESHTSSGVVL